MKPLTASALVCALMALTRAAAAPDGIPVDDQEGETELVKRTISCPSEWTELGRRCYRYVPRSMTWARAEKNCLSQGGHLASASSLSEYRNIQKVILSATQAYHQAWIGGTDAQELKYWFWTDGKPFNYQYWCQGEPNNLGGYQHCLQINHGDGKCWDDLNCAVHLPSVCSRD
ncbi:ladderlectin-like [Plectropomus leopardus]|uniref:ladderlectin-like n=1 Tax=Plectropomus leopardus TaxID=160734 RepID=UPI001C4B43E7|nr:ladderlectin-like [Plectropomus leopardus]